MASRTSRSTASWSPTARCANAVPHAACASRAGSPAVLIDSSVAVDADTASPRRPSATASRDARIETRADVRPLMACLASSNRPRQNRQRARASRARASNSASISACRAEATTVRIDAAFRFSSSFARSVHAAPETSPMFRSAASRTSSALSDGPEARVAYSASSSTRSKLGASRGRRCRSTSAPARFIAPVAADAQSWRRASRPIVWRRSRSAFAQRPRASVGSVSAMRCRRAVSSGRSAGVDKTRATARPTSYSATCSAARVAKDGRRGSIAGDVDSPPQQRRTRSSGEARARAVAALARSGRRHLEMPSVTCGHTRMPRARSAER